jgi:hypothetical protein
MEWSWWMVGVAVVAVIVVVSSLRWSLLDFVLDRFGSPRDA